MYEWNLEDSWNYNHNKIPLQTLGLGSQNKQTNKQKTLAVSNNRVRAEKPELPYSDESSKMVVQNIGKQK